MCERCAEGEYLLRLHLAELTAVPCRECGKYPNYTSGNTDRSRPHTVLYELECAHCHRSVTAESERELVDNWQRFNERPVTQEDFRKAQREIAVLKVELAEIKRRLAPSRWLAAGKG